MITYDNTTPTETTATVEIIKLGTYVKRMALCNMCGGDAAKGLVECPYCDNSGVITPPANLGDTTMYNDGLISFDGDATYHAGRSYEVLNLIPDNATRRGDMFEYVYQLEQADILQAARYDADMAAHEVADGM